MFDLSKRGGSTTGRRALRDGGLAAWLVRLAVIVLAGRGAAATGEEISFSRQILPILSDACFQCHGPDPGSRAAELRFDEEESVKRDRGGYRVVAPGDPDASELFKRITSTDEYEQMPPPHLGRPLTKAQIAAVRAWIKQGADWGKHWSFNRVERPVAPTEGNPIDHFVDLKLAELGWRPTPRADKRTLIRRLSLDLTGLPPTPEEVDEFLADNQPGGWERLVDRKLASPAFGERMAWDWLEAARYADSNGYQGDNERTMWPWRDWVVDAFNNNLPYDQFTVWQLAGDLLPEASREQVLATAFNRNHMINGEGGRIAEENRVDYVMDMAETMGTVWLGLTLNCCRCHDHKFDPITQTDYYAFNAFFNQTPVTGKGGDPQTKPVLDFASEEELAELADAEAAVKAAEKVLIAEEDVIWPRGADEPASRAPNLRDLPRQIRDAADRRPTGRDYLQMTELRRVFGDDFPDWVTKYKEYNRVVGVRDRFNSGLTRVMVMRDMDEPRRTYLLDRGLYSERREEVTAGVPEVLPPLPDGQPANRLALARWLVSRDHPLTSRVTVNRFWQMLFGIGLVKTTEDFGVQAEFPYHPELLDWLAAEFMESGWDTKRLLRTILTSEAYARGSAAPPEDYARDPANRYFARGARFRMPSWMIRDQALAVSGLINPARGGKSVNVYQPGGVWEEATFGKKSYKQDSGAALYRRSLYVFWRRIVGPTIFFDSAKRQVCEVKVARTNTPMHALAILNDVTYVEAARALAERTMHSADGRDDRLQKLASFALARPISDREAGLWGEALDRARAEFAERPERAAEFLSIGDSRRDDSLPLAEHAAWTTLCLNVLNLDETLTRE